MTEDFVELSIERMNPEKRSALAEMRCEVRSRKSGKLRGTNARVLALLEERYGASVTLEDEPKIMASIAIARIEPWLAFHATKRDAKLK